MKRLIKTADLTEDLTVFIGVRYENESSVEATEKVYLVGVIYQSLAFNFRVESLNEALVKFETVKAVFVGVLSEPQKLKANFVRKLTEENVKQPFTPNLKPDGGLDTEERYISYVDNGKIVTFTM